MPPVNRELLREASSYRDLLHAGTIVLEGAYHQDVDRQLITATMRWNELMPPATGVSEWSEREDAVANLLTSTLPVGLASALNRAAQNTVAIENGTAVRVMGLAGGRAQRRALAGKQTARNTAWHQLSADRWGPEGAELLIATEEPQSRAQVSTVLRSYLEMTFPRERGNERPSETSILSSMLRGVLAGASRRNGSDQAANISEYQLRSRTDIILRLAEFELTELWLDETITIAQIGTPGEKLAKQLWADDAPRRAWSPDIAAKRAMMEEVVATYDGLTANPQVAANRQQQQTLRSLAGRARATLDTFDRLLGDLRAIYQSFGYELPESLREPVEQDEIVVTATGVSAVSETVVLDLEEVYEAPAAEPAREIDPAITAELERRTAELEADTADFRSRWSWVMRTKDRKPYDGLVNALKRGFTLADGTPSITFGDPKTLVGMLTRLHFIAQRAETPEAGAERLAGAVARQRELIGRNREVMAWANGNGIMYNGTDVYDVHGLLTSMSSQANWRTISEAISHGGPWPNLNGSVVPGIRALLDAYAARTNIQA